MGNVETLESYEEISELGKGSFGSVTLVKHKKTGVKYALKRIYTERNPKTADKEKEIVSYKKLKSPFLVEYFDVYEDQKNVYFLMEFCDGGDLEHLQNSRRNSGQPIKEHEILRILFQCLMGLNGLHSNNFIHRDIKAANVYFAGDGNIRIGDFGTAKQLDSINSLTNTFVGSISNMPPEVINRVPYTSKCDIYSLGVMVYELMTFRNPFNMNVGKIIKGAYEKIEDPLFSNALKELVYSMIRLDPKDRPTCEELLQHPLMQRQQILYSLKQIKEVGTAALTKNNNRNNNSSTSNSVTSSVGGVSGGSVGGIGSGTVSGDSVVVGNITLGRNSANNNRNDLFGSTNSRSSINSFDGIVSGFACVDSVATAIATATATGRATTGNGGVVSGPGLGSSPSHSVTSPHSPPPANTAAGAHAPALVSKLPAACASSSPTTSSSSSSSSFTPLSSFSSSLSSSTSSFSSSSSHSPPPVPPPPLLHGGGVTSMMSSFKFAPTLTSSSSISPSSSSSALRPPVFSSHLKNLRGAFNQTAPSSSPSSSLLSSALAAVSSGPPVLS